MTDREHITLLREVVQEALEFVTSNRWGTRPYMEGQVYGDAHDLAKALRTALAAPRLEVTVDPRLTAEEAAAISAALAAEQPKQEAKQEPVAYFDLQKQVFFWAKPTQIDVPMTIALEPLPLYAAPPDAEALRREIERLREALEMIAGHRPCVIDGFKRGFMPGAEIAKAALRREETT